MDDSPGRSSQRFVYPWLVTENIPAVIPTVLVMDDQLDRERGVLAGFSPTQCRVLMIESRAKLTRFTWHRQRLHLCLSAARHFAAELTTAGFTVDYRVAADLQSGVVEHCDDFDVERVLASCPTNRSDQATLERLGVEICRSDFFITDPAAFSEWAADRTRIRMEDFYRQQRQRLGVLMDGAEPAGGRWNFDHDNREPPPKDGREWPKASQYPLDDIDQAVMDDIEADPAIRLWGAGPVGLWPVTKAQAQQRLESFIADGLAPFGAHEDAMLADEWKLAHSILSTSINLGLLDPLEVVRSAEAAYREEGAPINSVEGFIRQVMGWREYVWVLYWHFGADYPNENFFAASRSIPPAFTQDAPTEMACLDNVITKVHDRGFAHHIERLMVLGNLALLTGVDPWAMTEWMWANFVDADEWVMVPNVIGMALHADGGKMATKPYAGGGAYINRMSDHCTRCRFNPKKRTGDDACPFTSLYWDFLARNEDQLSRNHRMGQQLAGMRRLADLAETRERAAEVMVALDAGAL